MPPIVTANHPRASRAPTVSQGRLRGATDARQVIEGADDKCLRAAGLGHPTCSFITCCVKRKGLEVCGQCAEFPCFKFKSEEKYRQVAPSSSYPPSGNVLSNLRFIREQGITEFMRRQQRRIGLLEMMIEAYDDGRSRSFFCRASALLDIKALESSLNEAKKAMRAGGGACDAVEKAKVLRGILTEASRTEGIELTRRKW